jgi:hypothetical protein
VRVDQSLAPQWTQRLRGILPRAPGELHGTRLDDSNNIEYLLTEDWRQAQGTLAGLQGWTVDRAGGTSRIICEHVVSDAVAIDSGSRGTPANCA